MISPGTSALHPHAAVLLLLAVGAFAPRWAEAEGVSAGTFEYTVKNEKGAGRVELEFSPVGVRALVAVGAQGLDMKITTIVKRARPDTAVFLNEATRLYAEVDLTERRGQGGAWRAKKLGEAKVGGYACVEHEVTQESGRSFKVWTTKDVRLDAATAAALVEQAGADRGLHEAVRASGGGDVVVKLVGSEGKGQMVLELQRLSDEAVSPARFEVPAGFTKGTMMDVLVPEGLQKKMEEMMKKLTPEQKARLEGAMKKGGAR
jgi:hypothetical protein